MASIPSLNRRPRSRPGFSLIEILIVMVMVGVLLGVSVPRIGRQITRDRVLRSALVVQGMLDEATQFAARQRAPVNVSYDAGTGRLSVTDRDAGTVFRSRTFGSDQDLRASLRVLPTTITIFPNGRSNAAQTIVLSGGDYTTTVTRSATGIVRRQ